MSSEWKTEEPEALGFDAQGLQNVERVIQRGLNERVYPAAVYLILRNGKSAAQGAFGFAQPDANPPIPAAPDTIFDAASLTKPFTAVLLLQLVEAGEIHLGQKVSEFLPQADSVPIGNLTLRQLATHTSGLPPWIALHAAKREPLAEIISTPLQTEPGTRYAYSDLGYILLGEILAHITQTPLDQLAHNQIFAPCGMTRTGFRPDAALRPQIAATANCPARPGQILVGEVHDANAWRMNGVAGHAGVFSTAPDLARFALHADRLLHDRARHLFHRNQIAPTIGGHSIGFFTPPNAMLPSGDLLSEHAFGHTGFTGTLLLCDPVHDLTAILLTNRVYYTQESSGMIRLRRLFANAIAGAML